MTVRGMTADGSTPLSSLWVCGDFYDTMWHDRCWIGALSNWGSLLLFSDWGAYLVVLGLSAPLCPLL